MMKDVAPRLSQIIIIVFLVVFPLVVQAGIVGSWHDLSWLSGRHSSEIPGSVFGNPVDVWGSSPRGWNDYNEVCVYCHTPHHAQTAVPLWNRGYQPGVFSMYHSSNVASPGIPSPSSLLCLSCHDGSIAVDKVVNLGATPAQWGSSDPSGHNHMGTRTDESACADCHVPSRPSSWTLHTEGKPCSSCHAFGRWVDLTSSLTLDDLSNDHPISITYGISPDLVPKPASGIFSNDVKLIDGKVECASCHDPHTPYPWPFLRTANSGSALCYTCHKK